MKKRSYLLLIALWFVAVAHMSAATIYEQNFVGLSGTITAHNWLAYQSATAVPVTTTTASYRAGSINNLGKSDNPPATPSAAVAGYIFAQNFATSTSGTVTTAASSYFLHMNSTLPTVVDLDGYQNLGITWNQSASNANTGVRLAIKLDNGLWYVTSSASTTPGSQGNTTFTAFTSNVLTQTWNALNFTPSSTLSINPASLSYATMLSLGNNITALGFYIDSLPGTSATPGSDGFVTLRLDAITITGDLVPEPSRTLLLGFAAVGLLVRRQRKVRLPFAS